MSSKCTKATTDSNVKVEENKRKAVFKNPDRSTYHVTQIDGCLITNGIRSDYLVSKLDVASVIIELKGSDVSHACSQLLATVACVEMKPLLANKYGFLVVCSKYPKFDTFVRKAKDICAKTHKAGFHVVCDRGEFDIERVAAINGPY